MVPDSLVELWKGDVGDQLTCQIEMFAYVTVRYLYAELTKLGLRGQTRSCSILYSEGHL